MFGRLLNPFLARIYRLDRAALRGVDDDFTDTPGSGYDDDFREPILDDPFGLGIGSPKRPEMDPVDIRVQIIGRASAEALRMLAGGNAPEQDVELGASAAELEADNLLGPDLLPIFRPGDRLGEILTTAGSVVWRIDVPPGLYFVQATPTGWGGPILAPRRNLFRLVFQDRQVSARRRTG